MFVSPSFKILLYMTTVRSLEFASLVYVCYHNRSLRWHRLLDTPIVRSNQCTSKKKKKKKRLIQFERLNAEEGTHGSSFSRLCVSSLTIVFFLIIPALLVTYIHATKKSSGSTPSAEFCINQNSIVLVSEFNKFHTQESSCMQKEHSSITASQSS